MLLRLLGNIGIWGKYASELLIVAAGVALGLWATEWVAARNDAAEVRDASRALHDELTDNFEVIEYRKDAEPCVRRRIADLRSWVRSQQGGGRTALPNEIGRPGSYAILDSVWEVSKAGEVASKMPVEERRRYAAVYDVLESFAEYQRAERDVWFEINDFAGLSDLGAGDLARLNGLVRRAEVINEALSTNRATLIKDLVLLGVGPTNELAVDLAGSQLLCTPLNQLRGGSPKQASS